MKKSILVVGMLAVAVIVLSLAKESLQSKRPAAQDFVEPAPARVPPARVPTQDVPPPTVGETAEKPVPPASADPHVPLPGSGLPACLKSGLPTMADFGRGWCKPCKAMVPLLKQAARDYRGKAHIVFVELDEYARLGREYRIAAMPTQIFFDAKGKEVSRHIGYLDNKGIDSGFANLKVKK